MCESLIGTRIVHTIHPSNVPFGEVGRFGAGTTYPSGEPPVLSGVLVARALVVCSVFCRSLIALLFFFLLAIAFFDLPILITLYVISRHPYNSVSNAVISSYH
jgi:hypothetical protein